MPHTPKRTQQEVGSRHVFSGVPELPMNFPTPLTGGGIGSGAVMKHHVCDGSVLEVESCVYVMLGSDSHLSSSYLPKQGIIQ